VLGEGGVTGAEIGVEEGVTDGFEGADMGEEQAVVILREWRLLTDVLVMKMGGEDEIVLEGGTDGEEDTESDNPDDTESDGVADIMLMIG
jgi:hypothetical protein